MPRDCGIAIAEEFHLVSCFWRYYQLQCAGKIYVHSVLTSILTKCMVEYLFTKQYSDWQIGFYRNVKIALIFVPFASNFGAEC